jgi:hypothetical protein
MTYLNLEEEANNRRKLKLDDYVKENLRKYVDEKSKV